jgi:hypothetical protein
MNLRAVLPESAPRFSPEPRLGAPDIFPPPPPPMAPSLEVGDVGESRFSQSPVISFLQL